MTHHGIMLLPLACVLLNILTQIFVQFTRFQEKENTLGENNYSEVPNTVMQLKTASYGGNACGLLIACQ